jgi:asparagine synthase (glutamine-hydrolysing)
MQAAMRHRGPDDRGLEVVPTRAGPPVVLAHTRLAVVELSPSGHQPMWDEPPRGTAANVVIFNGEIYNFRELGAELTRAGFACRTRSDTEVILQAYRAWGARAVERFEGMFAFALYDADRQELVLARDRVGIKPLYLRRLPTGGLVFASELRALLAAGPELAPPRLHRAALEAFLAQGAVASDASVVEGVDMLPPGECSVFDVYGRLQRTIRYWSVQFGREAGADTRPADGSVPARAELSFSPLRYRSETVSELGWALRRSVQRLLLADVPVGLFLSSGVDSSSIAALSTESPASRVFSIGVGLDHAALDESEGTMRVANALGTTHHQHRLSGADVLASFDSVLAAMDQPTVDGFNTYFVSQSARAAGLTVALSGLGGDEIFGGYASFADVPRASRLTRPFRSNVWRDERSWFALPPSLRSRAGMKAHAALARAGDLIGLYFLRRELFLPAERRALHTLPSGSDSMTGIDSLTMEDLRGAHVGRAPLDRIAFLEFSTYMRYMLLRDADVFSMAHSLELRVPLLEHYVVERAAAADSRYRRPDPRLKPLLIDAVGPRLPAHTFTSKKRGFTFPWEKWLRGALRERVRSALSEPETWRRVGVDPKGVEASFRRFDAGDRSLSPLQILGLVVLEDYCRRHRLHV